MKKNLFLLPLAALMLVACSSSRPDEPEMPLEGDTPITLAVRTDGLFKQDTRAGAGIIDGESLTSLAISLFRADQSSGEYSTYVSTPTNANVAATTNINANGQINTGLFYLSNTTQKSKLIGFYPQMGEDNAAWSADGRTVTYPAIDGATDILYSNFVEGSKTTPISATMTFGHALTQVEVTVTASSADAAALWGAINSINLVGKEQDIVLTLPVPNTDDAVALTTTGNANLPLVTTVAPLTLSTSETTFGYAMFAPVTIAAPLDLSIATSLGATVTKQSASQVYAAGQKYKIDVVFSTTGIKVNTVAITDWGNGGTQTPITVN